MTIRSLSAMPPLSAMLSLSVMPRARVALMLAALMLAALAFSATARTALGQGIAAVVDDQLITIRDLENRTHMVTVISNLPDTPETRTRLHPQVLAVLIEEHLQRNEFRRLNITVTDRDLADAKRVMEQRMRIPEGGFDTYIKANAIHEPTIITQLRTSIAWTRLVRRRFNTASRATDDEVQEILDKYQRTLNEPEYRLSEILLPVDSLARDEEVRSFAEQLAREIGNGGNFAALARQFSSSASAGQGGALGWVLGSQLAPELEAALTDAKLGRIIGPVRTVRGYHLLNLDGRRLLGAPDPMQTLVTLKQIFLPLSEGALESEIVAQKIAIRQIRGAAKSCDDIEPLAAQFGSVAPPALGTFRINDLSPTLREPLAELAVGVPSTPVRMSNGILMLMVCKKVEQTVSHPTREEIAQRLQRQKLETFSRRYLRDLRRDAFVETRL